MTKLNKADQARVAQYRQVLPGLPGSTLKSIGSIVTELYNEPKPRKVATANGYAEWILESLDHEIIEIMDVADDRAVYRFSEKDLMKAVVKSAKPVLAHRKMPAKAGVVMITHPRTRERVYGLALGGGQTLKVWEPSLGSQFSQWKIEWTDVDAFDLVMPHTMGKYITVHETAIDYFRARFNGGEDRNIGSFEDWLKAQLKKGVEVGVTERFHDADFGGTANRSFNVKVVRVDPHGILGKHGKTEAFYSFRNITHVA